MMDIRVTVAVHEDFLPILTDCKEKGKKAELILDKNGLERAEGLVKEVYPEQPEPYFELEGGTVIRVKELVAVNGLFLPPYAEC